MKEIFKAIKGYEGIYEISSLGKIQSLERKVKGRYDEQYIKSRFLKAGINGAGYYFVVLCKRGITKNHRIHRLVATTFILNPENKRTVNHKDGVKTNNNVSNLEWVTQSENIKHAYEMGLSSSNHCRGEKHRDSKLKDFEILQIRDLSRSKRFNKREIADLYNIDASAISRITTNKRWKHI